MALPKVIFIFFEATFNLYTLLLEITSEDALGRSPPDCVLGVSRSAPSFGHF